MFPTDTRLSFKILILILNYGRKKDALFNKILKLKLTRHFC